MWRWAIAGETNKKLRYHKSVNFQFLQHVNCLALRTCFVQLHISSGVNYRLLPSRTHLHSFALVVDLNCALYLVMRILAVSLLTVSPMPLLATPQKLFKPTSLNRWRQFRPQYAIHSCLCVRTVPAC